MSRTFKDRPYRVVAREALDHGYRRISYWSAVSRPDSDDVWYADVEGYAYTRHNRNLHVQLDRMRMFRWIEGGWSTDYGLPREVRDRLRLAVRDANSGLIDEDWDDPVLYQRRRIWRE